MISFEIMNSSYLDKVLEIYNYYILNSTASFHSTPLNKKEMEQILFSKKEKYKTYIIKHNQDVCGYIMLSPYKDREAYQASAEITIYLHHKYLNKGIGTKALNYIENKSYSNFHALLAVICAENKDSISLFEKNGYFKCGHLKQVGEKFNRYLDVVIYQKILL